MNGIKLLIVGRTLLPLMILISAPQIATAASDSGTLTVGIKNVRCGGIGIEILDWSGYANGLMGSYGAIGLTGGETLGGVYDAEALANCGSISESVFIVSGFSSNPGSSWLTSVKCNGVTNLQSAATAYTYSSGQATWNWTQLFGLRSQNGNNVSCTIVHT